MFAADPVPFVPPSGAAIDAVKAVVRLLPYLGGLEKFVINLQRFRHYGDQRYIPIVDTEQGDRFHILTNVNPFERLHRAIKRKMEGGLKRPDRYHNMGGYRRKLMLYSGWRQNGDV